MLILDRAKAGELVGEGVNAETVHNCATQTTKAQRNSFMAIIFISVFDGNVQREGQENSSLLTM